MIWYWMLLWRKSTWESQLLKTNKLLVHILGHPLEKNMKNRKQEESTKIKKKKNNLQISTIGKTKTKNNNNNRRELMVIIVHNTHNFTYKLNRIQIRIHLKQLQIPESINLLQVNQEILEVVLRKVHIFEILFKIGGLLSQEGEEFAILSHHTVFQITLAIIQVHFK